jgi:hypothetical protein
MQRDLLETESDGSDPQSDSNSIGVNVYGSTTSSESQIATAVGGLSTLLNHLYRFDCINGYEIKSYETDAPLYQAYWDDHNDLITEGYTAIENSDCAEDHYIVIWIYNNYYYDDNNCPDDCWPDIFMMGDGLDEKPPFRADCRQPYVHQPEPDLYDIQQGFVYTAEDDPKSGDDWCAAHELGHALITKKDPDTADLIDESVNTHPDHTLGEMIRDTLGNASFQSHTFTR